MAIPLKILLVEDNPNDAELVLRELGRAGYEPTCQRVDTEAAYLEKLDPGLDLVISDFAMPRFDGLRALELLTQRGLEVPFILVSGTIGEEMAVKAIKDGAADYLLKDRLARLGPAVSQTLEQSRLRRERRQAEEQLRLQGTALETVANAITITDRNGMILWANPAFHALTGYSRPETIGQNPRLLKSGRHDRSFYEALWRTILSGETWQGELVNRRKDGSHYYGEQTITPVRGVDGTITHFVGVMTDVTARKKAEEKLREADAHLYQLVSRSPTVIYSLKLAGDEGVPSYVSANIVELTGFTVEESIAPNWWRDHLHPDDREVARACLRQAVEQGSSRAEYRVRHKSGAFFWVEDRKRALPDASGKPAEVVGGWTDITTRKEAEAALRESEDRFRQVVENIHEVFWMSDPARTTMLYISPAYETIWGRTCASWQANPLNWVERLHPDDRDRVVAAARTKLSRGDYDEKYRIIRPDGTLRWIEEKAFPVPDANGKVQRVVGVAQDITERKQMEEKFLRTQRLEAVGSLASGVAHDLNNILAPMLMAAGLLKLKLTEPHDLQILTLVENGAARGAAIIRQLLTFSRGIDGARVIVQLRHLLKEMEHLMKETFPRGIEIRQSAPGDLWVVPGDVTQLHQVFMNLCVNARDAMGDQGVLTLQAKNAALTEPEVRHHPQAKAGPYVVVTVTDTGHGIPPEIIDRIFDPFFTTKELGKGTGLGLSTVIGIAKSHGGFVTVESEPHKGTTFAVCLPAAPAMVEAPADGTVAPYLMGKGELILVVDDEAPIREMLVRLLEGQNFRVLTAGNGLEAIELIVQHRETIKLMVTDMMMPGMGGLELIRSLRILEPAIRIIGTSGMPQEQNRSMLAALAVTAMLAKPYTPQELLTAIATALAG